MGEIRFTPNGARPAHREARNLLATTAGLRWFLAGEGVRDQVAEEVLEYEAAKIVLHELEMRYPNLRPLLDGVETAGRLAAGVRLARETDGPDAVVMALEEQLDRQRAVLAGLMARIPHSEPEKLLVAYARVIDVACATTGA